MFPHEVFVTFSMGSIVGPLCSLSADAVDARGLVDFEFLWLLPLARALPEMSLYGLLFYMQIGHVIILRPQGTCLYVRLVLPMANSLARLGRMISGVPRPPAVAGAAKGWVRTAR
jgi:hypothetical protein